MLELLHAFAGLTLLSGALLSLMPQGGLRRAAGMAVGLMMMMLWAQGLRELGASLLGVSATQQRTPPALFQPTVADLSDAEQAAMNAIIRQEVSANEP